MDRDSRSLARISLRCFREVLEFFRASYVSSWVWEFLGGLGRGNYRMRSRSLVSSSRTEFSKESSFS